MAMSDDQAPAGATEGEIPACPKCSGEMWDNRVGKRNPKAPDFKCKDKSCDGVVWPPRDATAPGVEPGPPAPPTGGEGDPACPVCGGKMWDDRVSKRNPKAPDFKCRNKPKVQGGPGCPGIIWPPRDGERRPAAAPSSRGTAAAPRTGGYTAPPRTAPTFDAPPPDDADFTGDDDDELPF